MTTDRSGMTTKELWDDLIEGLKIVGQRIGAMEADPSVTAESFARIVEACASVLEQGVHADMAADLRSQSFSLISQMRLNGTV